MLEKQYGSKCRMSKKSQEANAIKLARAKTKATISTIRLLVLLRGSFALVVAGSMTLLLVSLFHLNAPLTFAGSLFGMLALTFSSKSIRLIWASKLASACQEEGLWNIADDMASEGIEDAMASILAGRYPQTTGPELVLKVSQLQMISIRKGDLKTALKYSEFLYRESNDDPKNRGCQASSLACCCIELGDYNRGFELLAQSLDNLEQDGRSDSPAFITALLGMVRGSLDLERIVESEKYLHRLKEVIAFCHSKSSSDRLDEFVKQEVSARKIEPTFAAYFSARLKDLKGDPESELEILAALDMVKDPDVMKKVTLLYPEMIGFHAHLMLKKNALDQAEKLCRQAIGHYETKTVNKGNEYIKTKRLLAYIGIKKGANKVLELENLLEETQKGVFEPHPNVATANLQLGEAYAKAGESEKARACLSQCLKIRQALFPESSPGIREVEDQLAKLPESKGGKSDRDEPQTLDGVPRTPI